MTPDRVSAPTTSLRSLLLETITAHPERPALSYRRAPDDGRAARHGPAAWQTLTWHETAVVLVETIDRLDEALGPFRRVAVLAETDARYPVLELALALAGRSLQPLYVTSPDGELLRGVSTADAQVLVAGSTQLGRARGLAVPVVPVVPLASLVRLPGTDGGPAAALPADVEPFDTTGVRQRLAALPQRASGAPLLFLQSTGTTGPARVVEFSEEAMVASVEAVRGEAHPFPRLLSYLPTGHISERLLTTYVALALAGHTWHGRGLTSFAWDLQACRPTLFLAPPLLLDAIRDQSLTAATASAAGRRLATAVARTADRALMDGRSGAVRRPLGARLFGRKLRRAAGLDQVRDAFVGTAPAPAELQAWWEAAGMPLRNIYGQTEVAGATSITARSGASFAGVGSTVPGVEARIGEVQELLVHSRSAFTRYVGNPASTARVLQDGWLHTGDRAALIGGEIVLLGRVPLRATAPDGSLVDTEVIAAGIRAEFPSADVVVATADQGPGVHLYVGFPAPGVPVHQLREKSHLSPVAASDPRWHRITALLRRLDRQGVVRDVALFDGVFTLATGEVGPTGKVRAWRVHQLRAAALRARAEPLGPVPAPRQAPGVERIPAWPAHR
jgi:long-chain acyl-CoA synthetase